MQISFVVQLELTGWGACTKQARLRAFCSALQTYVLYQNGTVTYKVLEIREQGHTTQYHDLKADFMYFAMKPGLTELVLLGRQYWTWPLRWTRHY